LLTVQLELGSEKDQEYETPAFEGVPFQPKRVQACRPLASGVPVVRKTESVVFWMLIYTAEDALRP
jgi:hypothetical protein